MKLLCNNCGNIILTAKNKYNYIAKCGQCDYLLESKSFRKGELYYMNYTELILKGEGSTEVMVTSFNDDRNTVIYHSNSNQFAVSKKDGKYLECFLSPKIENNTIFMREFIQKIRRLLILS